MKAKREQKKAEQIVIKLFSRNYARDLLSFTVVLQMLYSSSIIHILIRLYKFEL